MNQAIIVNRHLSQSGAADDQRQSHGLREGILTVLLCVPAAVIVMAAHWVIFKGMWAGDSNEYDSLFGAAAFLISDLVVVVAAVSWLARHLRSHGAGEADIIGFGMGLALVVGLVYVFIGGSSIAHAASYRWRFTIFSSAAYCFGGLLYASIRKPVFALRRQFWGWLLATGVLMLPILISSFWKPSHDMILWVLGTWIPNAAVACGASLVSGQRDRG